MFDVIHITISVKCHYDKFEEKLLDLYPWKHKGSLGKGPMQFIRNILNKSDGIQQNKKVRDRPVDMLHYNSLFPPNPTPSPVPMQYRLT